MRRLGFSLLELVLVLVLLVGMLLIAAPVFQTQRRKVEGQAIEQQLLSAIQLARSEAIKLGTNVTLCPSDDQATCSGFWEDGQIVFVDFRKKGERFPDEKLLRVFPSLGNNQGKLQWKSFPAGNYLSFTALGITDYQNGTFQYFSQGSDDPDWKIIVSQSGRVRVE